VLRESSLFILDEPFSNLDDSNAIELEKTLLNLEGITVVNVSHVVFDQNLHMYDAVIKVDDKVVQLFPTNSSDLQL